MSIDRILQLKLVTDVGDINSKMAQATTATGKLGNAFKTITSFAGPVAINAAFVAIEQLSNALSTGMGDARRFDDAVSGLAGTLAPLGQSAADVQALADSTAAMASSLGFLDDDVAIRSLQAFAQQTRSVTEAQTLLAAAMDLARLKGISLEEATAKVQAIYKGSERTLKEFGVSGVTGLDAVTAALGRNQGFAAQWATTTQGQYATTAAAIDDAFQTLGSVINTTLDTVILPAVSQLIPVIGNLWSEWQPKLQAAADGVGTFVGKVIEVWNKLQPAIQSFLDFTAPIIDNFVIAVQTGFAIVTGVLDTVIALLNGDFSGAWNAITGVVQSMYDGVVSVIGNFLSFLDTVVTAAGATAGRVGDAIFKGIADGFNSLWGVVKEAANHIIDALNSINSFGWERQGFEINTPVGNAFVGFDAGSFQLWPDIPHLAKGGIVRDPTLALIGESGPEAVVPLGQGGGMGDTYNIHVSVSAGVSPAQVGKELVAAIQAYQRNGGAAHVKRAVLGG